MLRPRYLPILKWQDCEKTALKILCPDTKNLILPCIEVRKEVDIHNFSLQFDQIWGFPALVDFSNPGGELTGNRMQLFVNFLKDSICMDGKAIPVIDPINVDFRSDPELSLSISALKKLGLRLRINSSIDSTSLVESFLSVYSVIQQAVPEITVIIDCGNTPSIDDETISLLDNILQRVTKLNASQLYLSSGAFPDSLKSIKGADEIERSDWILWKVMSERFKNYPLGYSDYCTVNPTWSEEVLFKRGPHAIKYTEGDRWIIVRGQNNTLQEAINLSKIFFMRFGGLFLGKDFSEGDLHLWSKANDKIHYRAKKLSIAAHVWESINHHITYVVKKQCTNIQPNASPSNSILF